MTYGTYKKSNIPWIGDIPTHWSAQRIKDCLSFKIGGTPPTKINEYFEGNNIWVSISDISNNNGKYINDSSVKITDEAIRSSNVKLIKKDSLLFSFKLSVGLTTFAGCDLYTNEAIASFEPNKNVDLNFLKYVFSAGFENNAAENIYGAKLFNSDLINFGKFVMPPSLKEQQQIANYLDRQTAKIDETITKNEELIELLEEKRVALINQVVTKGLNPDVSMKDSGVEWIGEIPEHWDMMKISNIFNNIGSGTTPKSSNDEYYIDGNVNWLITGDLNDNYIHNTSTKITKKALHDTSALKIYPKESLVIAMYGATIGKLGILNIETCTNQACCVLSRSKIMNIKYTYYWFLGYRNEIISLSYGGGQPNISQDVIKNLKCIVPPFNEQKQIIDYLDTEITKINKTITKVTENINLLEEYKTSLIHHVVTGKIDVRGEEI